MFNAISFLQKTLTLTAGAAFLTTGFALPSKAEDYTLILSQNQQPVSTVPGSNCRTVNAPNVDIRSEPGGEIVGRLEQNQTVYIANEGRNGWVPIEAPVNGYITAANLKPCSPDTANLYPTTENDSDITVPGGSCRRTNQANVPVFTQPGGQIVGQLNAGQTINIANEGENGWVPVETPISGYVDAAKLAPCQGG